jgi:hypothetical protein
MKPDDFEKQLQRQPLRELPAGWRAEILRAAHDSVAADVRRLQLPGQESQGLLTSAAASWWREWLWPCPQAWAALAAVWMIIIGLNATTPAGPANLARRPPTPSVETETTLAAQRRELARLLDNNFSDQAPAPKPPPGPRSEGTSPAKV